MGADSRGVQSIWFNGANGDHTVEADADEERTLTYVSEYHGDHECEWVIEKVDGEEVARHNIRFIASIRWASGPARSVQHKETP